MTLKYDLLTLKMTSDAVENDIIEPAVLKNPHIDPLFISSPSRRHWAKHGQKLVKLRQLTSKYELSTLKMTTDVGENDIIKIAILKNNYTDPENGSLALLQVT